MKLAINTTDYRYDENPREGSKLHDLLTKYESINGSVHVADKYLDAMDDWRLGYTLPNEVLNTLQKYDQISIRLMTAKTELGKEVLKFLDVGEYYTLKGKRYELIHGETVCTLILQIDPDSEHAMFYK